MGENAPRIVIVVLVVVVVLFFVGVGAGASIGNGGVSMESVIASLSGLFPSPQVGMDEIQASPSGCLNRASQRIVVPSGGVCQFQIASSEANVRSLKLQSAAGSVHLQLLVQPVKDKTMTIEADLPHNGSDTITLNFYQSGGRLTISQCTLTTGCVLNIVS